MNKLIYVVHWLAKEVNGHYVSSMIEYADEDKVKVEEYFKRHQHQEQVMNIDGHMCDIRRQIVPVELGKEYVK